MSHRTLEPSGPPATRHDDVDRLADGDLVQRIASGDDSAFGAVIGRHGRSVFYAAIAVVGERGAAEEVVQDVFLRLWRSPSAYDADRGTLASWLHMTCHSAAVDLVRKRAAQRRRDLAHEFSRWTLQPDDEGEPALVFDSERSIASSSCTIRT